MKLAIMQPYLFPYIGYFQLISAVDHFVVYDDAQWMKGGWINRNRFLVGGAPRYFTLPVARTSHTQRINERLFADDVDVHKKKILRQLKFSYSRAPYFKQVLALVTDCFRGQQREVSCLLVNCLDRCCDYMGIDTPTTLSSAVEAPTDLTGEKKVIHISRALGASHYINPVGGSALYDGARFKSAGLKLSFLRSLELHYPQLGGEVFQPSLSIIDVLMFNTPQQVSALLNAYTLERAGAPDLEHYSQP
jgi:hypothetical protein